MARSAPVTGHRHTVVLCSVEMIRLTIFWRQVATAIVLTVVTSVTTRAQTDPATQPAASDQHPQPNQTHALPHVAIDRQHRYVDLDATVNLREGGWLELLACTPQTRTHESILVVHAKPSHIHLALQLLNLQPGAPMRWRHVDDQYQAQPAHGPQVTVNIVTPTGDGAAEVPANQWIINKQTGKTLTDPIWIFTGSSFDDSHDPPAYRADIDGSVLSLVHFGDEVLARPGDRTHHNDQGILQPHTERIPDVGTPVKIRIRPFPARDTNLD